MSENKEIKYVIEHLEVRIKYYIRYLLINIYD